MKIFAYLALLFLVLFLLGFIAGITFLQNASIVLMFVCFALFVMGHPILKSFAFTIWVLAFVSASLIYPLAFGSWFGFDLQGLIVPLIQIIMFGMGTTLSLQDFVRVAKMPWPVFIGFALQYTIMPFVGLSIATVFGFEPEIAAGVILIGACPGGVASNVMTFLAGGNVPLSVTMTACSTLASPVVTPFYMKVLAGKLVPIHFLAMMLSILNMIVVPIIVGLIANRILYGQKKVYQNPVALISVALISLAGATITLLIPSSAFGVYGALRNGLIVGLVLLCFSVVAKLIINIWMKKATNWMDRVLPIVSMAGICFIIAIITARSADQLKSIGLAIILAAMLHNLTGYLLGYWLARAAKLDERDSRTVAIEVGLQNGGMASGLAMTVLNSAKAALAPAIFGPWMNISGSILANYWQRKKPRQQQ